ncbi:MAG: thioredoxin domain-containing protein [Candidatus Diapherotrites archaeon]|nr:thioredoxin domain-containing protein [Candidatus Diapherotrites archaeon]
MMEKLKKLLSEECPWDIPPGTWYLIIVFISATLMIGILAGTSQVLKEERVCNMNVPSSSVSNIILPIRTNNDVNHLVLSTLTRLRYGGSIKNTRYNFANGKWLVDYEAKTNEGLKIIEVRVDDRTLKIEKIYFVLMTPELSPSKINLDGQPIKGNMSAKLTIVEFGDFDCAYCRNFYRTTYKKIIKDYVDTGKAKYVFINFPLTSIHPRSERAAEAAECAYDQGKFWEYHDVLYDNWDPESLKDALSDEDLKSYAMKVGLDMEEFNTCFGNGEKVSTVQGDYQLAIKEGAIVAPSFYIGDSLIGGAQPFVMMKRIIDYNLA